MRYLIGFILLFILIAMPGEFVHAMQEIPAPLLPNSPDQAPIDGGLGLLAAAGGLYAYKKLRNSKQQ